MEKSSPRSTLGLIIFLMTEVMFFAGLLSAYWVLRTQVLVWPPLGQPRYPVEITALNTLLLIASGYLIWLAEKRLSQAQKKYLGYLLAAFVGGLAFLALQGYEWWQLMAYGMRLNANVYGGMFYLLVGSHAFHALIGLMVLAVLLFKALRGKYSQNNHQGFRLGRIYWLFVVMLWPVIYVALYLL